MAILQDMTSSILIKPMHRLRPPRGILSFTVKEYAPEEVLVSFNVNLIIR